MRKKPSLLRRFRKLITPKFVRPYAKILKEEGFKALLKKAGWKVVVLIVLFYLIRDSILYLLIPYLVAKGIF